MILTEATEYISHFQKRILNNVNWENDILPFFQLQKTWVKSKAAVLTYEVEVWIFVLLRSMITILCQSVAMIKASWE